MSALLQNVLAARLAQSSLDDQRDGKASTSTSSSTSSASQSGTGTTSLPTIVNGDAEEYIEGSDDELVNVMSLPGTVPGTPHISRPSSPGSVATAANLLRAGAALQASPKRSALSRTTTTSASPLRKSRTDPLRSLPKEVSQRIFLSLPVSALVSLSLVNRRYRRSATLNYCWYRQCHKDDTDAAESIQSESTGSSLKWTRRASKVDWKTHFTKQKRLEAREQQRLDSLPGSGTATPNRTQRLREEGIKTVAEQRREEWQEQDSQSFSKEEMREWYKSQGGSKGGKLKGKRGKGGAKTGTAQDGSLWE